MHSFDAPSGRTYFHDGDMSPGSDVLFHQTVRGQEATVYVPMADILALAAQHVRSREIARLEEASDEELLGLPPGTRD